MVQAARTLYPDLEFRVADCSAPFSPPLPQKFDIIFASWFFNYASSSQQLTNMFKVIEQNLAEGGKFAGITSNGRDELMHVPIKDFYGMDTTTLDPAYKDPETGEVLGVKVRITAHTEPKVEFEVYQFRAEIYERCAKEAGLTIGWKDGVIPEDERREREKGFWESWVQRPTFVGVQAWRSE